MRETVSKLVALQAIDDEGRGFHEERDSLQAKIVRLKELLELMEEGLAEKRLKLEEASRWYREKDGELKVDQEKVNRAKTRLQAVTKNKEYMAMQKEIESLRKANLAREEEILKLVEAMDEFKASIASEEKKIAELKAEVNAEEKSNAKRLEELAKFIDGINARKRVVDKELKPALVSRYRRIFKARDGRAVVPVTANSCPGCNYACPPQQVVRLRKALTLETCRHCSRILYWVDPPEVEEDAA